jgi:hypothetical protein
LSTDAFCLAVMAAYFAEATTYWRVRLHRLLGVTYTVKLPDALPTLPALSVAVALRR